MKRQHITMQSSMSILWGWSFCDRTLETVADPEWPGRLIHSAIPGNRHPCLHMWVMSEIYIIHLKNNYKYYHLQMACKWSKFLNSWFYVIIFLINCINIIIVYFIPLNMYSSSLQIFNVSIEHLLSYIKICRWDMMAYFLDVWIIRTNSTEPLQNPWKWYGRAAPII